MIYVLTHYLEDHFGIYKEDEIISPKTNKKVPVHRIIHMLEEKGKLQQVSHTIKAIQSLGRKGVITYLSKIIDQE
ncbi:hypothetical protein [Alkalihalophilus marmarensis]|uniref:hypothetical protein n=1 Tax=Alkalihalophilus marmarensis TaxID=521377 RepID=UPI000AC5CC77|nr:hypothetical protein [Alkalihalophilus marmarensis]